MYKFNEDKSVKIGITGTNRKSTTAFHLHQLFNNYKPSNLVGNIGNTMLDYIVGYTTYGLGNAD